MAWWLLEVSLGAVDLIPLTSRSCMMPSSKTKTLSASPTRFKRRNRKPSRTSVCEGIVTSRHLIIVAASSHNVKAISGGVAIDGELLDEVALLESGWMSRLHCVLQFSQFRQVGTRPSHFLWRFLHAWHGVRVLGRDGVSWVLVTNTCDLVRDLCTRGAAFGSRGGCTVERLCICSSKTSKILVELQMTWPRACGPPAKLSSLCNPSSRFRKARWMARTIVLTSPEALKRVVLPSCSRILHSLTGDGPVLWVSLELCIAKMRLQILAETPHRAVASSL